MHSCAKHNRSGLGQLLVTPNSPRQAYLAKHKVFAEEGCFKVRRVGKHDADVLNVVCNQVFGPLPQPVSHMRCRDQ